MFSVVPFIAGVALVSVWLHRNLGALSGLLFLFLCVASPLLLDITRQARGYGLAFGAMCVMVVAALEARRSHSTWLIAAFCAAGVVGTMTLPNFGVAFVVMAAVLLLEPALRVRAGLGLGAGLVLVAAWYAPHFGDIREGSRQGYGLFIEPEWLITAPIDQILLPAMIWIDGVVLFPGVRWLPLVAAAVLLMSASPLLRDRFAALLLCSGPVATMVTLWITDTRSVPRFLSFLLVPLFVLVATGIASIFERFRTRPQLVRTVVAFVGLALVAAVFVVRGVDVVRFPREDPKNAAAVIASSEYALAPVYARQVHPRITEFYLGRDVLTAKAAGWLRVACEQAEPVAVVNQPWVLPAAELPCASRPGVTRYRFPQYARGNETIVWLVPPSG
jgi:hypothetical protein